MRKAGLRFVVAHVAGASDCAPSPPAPRRRGGACLRRSGLQSYSFPEPRLVIVFSVVLACAFHSTALAQSQPHGTGVIVGTVVDEHHVPVSRAQVQAFSAEDVKKASEGSHRLGRSSGSSSTDAAGMFRISGLAAGDYVVAAEAIPKFPSG